MNLIDTLDRAGLTGRGGAAFRTAIKVEAAHTNGARLIVNACDGELGAAKDAHVVAHHLEELIRGARLVSRRPAIYAAHRGSATARRLAAAGLDVLEVPDRYVSSEESSLVSRANGGLARPLAKRRPIAFGATLADGTAVGPTVVLNAETVWRIRQIADRGVAWFRSFGTPDEPGPRLVAVGGAVSDPCVVEAAAGIRIADIVRAAGPRPVGHVGVSGLSGGWITAEEAADLPWSNVALAPFGLSTGAGILHVLPAGSCPLTTVRTWLEYAAGETAGQCGPCMFGVPAVVEDLVAVIDGRSSAATPTLRRRVELLRGRGACRFPDGVAGFVASVLRTFPTQLAQHAAGTCANGCFDAHHHHGQAGSHVAHTG